MKKALRVYELEKLENCLGDMKKRLDDIDLVHTPEDPRPSPQAYEAKTEPADNRKKDYQFGDDRTMPDPNPGGPNLAPSRSLSQTGDDTYTFPDVMPILKSMPCGPNSQPRKTGSPQGDVHVPLAAANQTEPTCRVVPGRYVPSPSCVAVPGHRLPGSAAVDPLFSRPAIGGAPSGVPISPGAGFAPAAAPIPGQNSTGLGNTVGDPFMCSMAYNLDRMANPEVAVKAGTIEGVRRMGEIHVYVARFFDNHLVALGPGITDKALAQHLKSLNERLRPLFGAYQIPTGFTNRLCIGAATLTWGGRDKEDEYVLTESDFVAWTPNDFDKYIAPSAWSLESKSQSSQRVETWRTNAVNMARMFSALYGAEYLDERAKCIEHLRQMHISYPHK